MIKEIVITTVAGIAVMWACADALDKHCASFKPHTARQIRREAHRNMLEKASWEYKAVYTYKGGDEKSKKVTIRHLSNTRW